MSGDSVASVLIGGMVTIANGAWDMHPGDLVQWYFDSEENWFYAAEVTDPDDQMMHRAGSRKLVHADDADCDLLLSNGAGFDDGYVHDFFPTFSCQYTRITQETYTYHKRDLQVSQKRPIHLTEETQCLCVCVCACVCVCNRYVYFYIHIIYIHIHTCKGRCSPTEHGQGPARSLEHGPRGSLFQDLLQPHTFSFFPMDPSHK